jgi:hypothetical protein
MGVFKLLARLCEEITQLIRRFWWAQDGGNRKVHWVAWDNLMRLVTELVRQPVCVEADCMNLIHAITRDGEDRLSWARVIKEIQAIRSLLPDCSFKHIKRLANAVAHELVQEALGTNQEDVLY